MAWYVKWGPLYQMPSNAWTIHKSEAYEYADWEITSSKETIPRFVMFDARHLGIEYNLQGIEVVWEEDE